MSQHESRRQETEDYELRRAVICPGCKSAKGLRVSGYYLGYTLTCSDCTSAPAGMGITLAVAVDDWNEHAKAPVAP